MKVCLRCGVPLGKRQRKWCVECGFAIGREADRARQKARRSAVSQKANSPRKRSSDEHFEWEADICLNCKKGRCTNCLITKSVEEKKALLEKSGGKKWLD